MIQAADISELKMNMLREDAERKVLRDKEIPGMSDPKENNAYEGIDLNGAAGYFDEEDDLDIDDFEIVSPEFFSQVKEPSFTVNVNKVYVNAACVRMLPDVEYVKILISRKRKQVAIEPSDEMDIKAYRWSKLKDGKRYASQRTGDMFVMMLCEMMGWDPDYRYKIIGRLVHSKGHSLVVFDLMTYNCYPKRGAASKSEDRKRSVFPIEKWNGRFGPTYAESKRSLQVKTFDEYTVWTIKEGETSSERSTRASNPSASVSEGGDEN